jgi:hypothetical protein
MHQLAGCFCEAASGMYKIIIWRRKYTHFSRTNTFFNKTHSMQNMRYLLCLPHPEAAVVAHCLLTIANASVHLIGIAVFTKNI